MKKMILKNYLIISGVDHQEGGGALVQDVDAQVSRDPPIRTVVLPKKRNLGSEADFEARFPVVVVDDVVVGNVFVFLLFLHVHGVLLMLLLLLLLFLHRQTHFLVRFEPQIFLHLQQRQQSISSFKPCRNDFLKI